jgi:YidC/Oxa1 family membrane protein insertase
MNQELMALYRERGVNPASGCLPMLLTMPVPFAFYSLLSVAIEMRGAPFALWIRDLSAHDPYYITPIIMAGTMLWQQRMTPVTDPSQQKIMMLTPLIFLTFFLWAPSGLVIYWTVSNLLGIGQQLLTNRIIGAPVVKQVRPPAERRIKNAGGGSTEAARKAAGK